MTALLVCLPALLSAAALPGRQDPPAGMLARAEEWTRANCPASPDVWVAYARTKALLKEGKRPEAEAILAGLVADATCFVPAYYYLGLIAAGDGREASAERYYRTALKIHPGFSLLRANFGNLLYREARFSEAAEQYERVIREYPDFARVHAHLARCCMEDPERFAEAILHFEEYLRLAGNPADATAVRDCVTRLRWRVEARSPENARGE